MIDLVVWLIQGLEALPLLIWLARLLTNHRDYGDAPDWWTVGLICFALFVSFVADVFGMVLAQEQRNTWFLGRLYLPLQFGVLLLAIAPDRITRLWSLLGFVAITGAAFASDWTRPDAVIQTTGCLFVGWWAYRNPTLGRYESPMLLYTWGRVPFVILMAWETVVPLTHPLWLWVWGTNQLVRAVVLAWCVGLLLRLPRRFPLEVIRGRFDRSGQGAGRGHRGADAHGDRTPLAAAPRR